MLFTVRQTVGDRFGDQIEEEEKENDILKEHTSVELYNRNEDRRRKFNVHCEMPCPLELKMWAPKCVKCNE